MEKEQPEVDEDLQDLVDYILGNPGHKEFLEYIKKLKRYHVDKHDRVVQLRSELERALQKAKEDVDDKGQFNYAYYQLEEAWQELSEYYEVVDRDEIVEDELLPAIFHHLELGRYPPPELLLVLWDRFYVYLAGRGEISLEEVFFGPPRRNAGNYAARNWASSSAVLLREISHGESKGVSKIKVAEKYIEKHNLSIDPASLLRRVKRREKKKHRQFYSDK